MPATGTVLAAGSSSLTTSTWYSFKPLPRRSCRIFRSCFKAIISLRAETRKCPGPTAGSQILIVFTISLASLESSILLYTSTSSFTIPFFNYIELLHNRFSDSITTHIHSNKTRCKEGTVFITVNFFKN